MKFSKVIGLLEAGRYARRKTWRIEERNCYCCKLVVDTITGRKRLVKGDCEDITVSTENNGEIIEIDTITQFTPYIHNALLDAEDLSADDWETFDHVGQCDPLTEEDYNKMGDLAKCLK